MAKNKNKTREKVKTTKTKIQNGAIFDRLVP